MSTGFLLFCCIVAVFVYNFPPKDKRTGKRPKPKEYWDEYYKNRNNKNMDMENKKYNEEMLYKADLYAHKKHTKSEARIKNFSESVRKSMFY